MPYRNLVNEPILRDRFIALIVAKIVADWPTNIELPPMAQTVTIDGLHYAEEEVDSLKPPQKATAAERVMLAIVLDTVGPLIGDDGVNPIKAQFTGMFDDIDGEIEHYQSQLCPGCGCAPGEGRTRTCSHPDGCGADWTDVDTREIGGARVRPGVDLD